MGISTEITPNLVFSKYNGAGIIPDGFFLKKSSFSFSCGVSCFYSVKSFRIYLGYNYFINNYKSVYFRDSESDKVPTNTNKLQTSFFEPKLTLAYNFNVYEVKNLFVEAGIGLSVSKSMYNDFKSEVIGVNAHGIQDTVVMLTSIEPLKNSSPIKVYFAIGKNFQLLKKKTERLNLGIFLSYRYSQNEEKISRSIIDSGKSYDFYYFRNSSNIGLSFRLMYYLGKIKSS
jgi:hypothetical protein